MGIDNVLADMREHAGGKSVDNMNIIGNESQSYTVEFSVGTDPLSMNIDALDSADIPQPWDVHPYDPWMYVQSLTVSYVSVYVRKVIVNYARIENPLNIAPQVSWTFASTSEPIDKDNKKKPILNSSDEPFDPPITEDFDDLVLRYIRNEAVFNETFAGDFKNAVNIDTFLGFPPGTCKLKIFSGDKTRAAGLIYWAVTYEIHIRYDESDPESTGNGWKRRILDQGFRTKDDDGNYETIKDKDGNPLSEPVKLDGEGGELAEGDDPIYLKFVTAKERNFSDLNIII